MILGQLEKKIFFQIDLGPTLSGYPEIIIDRHWIADSLPAAVHYLLYVVIPAASSLLAWLASVRHIASARVLTTAIPSSELVNSSTIFDKVGIWGSPDWETCHICRCCLVQLFSFDLLKRCDQGVTFLGDFSSLFRAYFLLRAATRSFDIRPIKLGGVFGCQDFMVMCTMWPRTRVPPHVKPWNPNFWRDWATKAYEGFSGLQSRSRPLHWHCGPRGCSSRYQLYEHLFCMFCASN